MNATSDLKAWEQAEAEFYARVERKKLLAAARLIHEQRLRDLKRRERDLVFAARRAERALRRAEQAGRLLTDALLLVAPDAPLPPRDLSRGRGLR